MLPLRYLSFIHPFLSLADSPSPLFSVIMLLFYLSVSQPTYLSHEVPRSFLFILIFFAKLWNAHTHTQPRLSSILNCRDNLTSSFLASRSPVEVVVPQCINRPDSSSSPPSVCTSELKPSSPLLSSALSSSLPLSPYQLENHVSGSPLITLPGNSSSQKASCFIFVV